MKATIVSLFPKAIQEVNPSVMPGVWDIPEAPEDGYSLTIIDPGRTYIYLDAERGQLPRIIDGPELAASLVNDWLGAQYFVNPECKPGLFMLEGSHTKESLKTDPKFISMLAKARISQNKWYERLAKRADDTWKKYGQHRFITDLERLAGRLLKIKREWITDFKPEDIMNCPACGSAVNKNYAICMHCKNIINEEKYKTLKFAEMKG